MTAPTPRRKRGLAARRSGRRGEVFCALWLMAKGYRLIGLRLRTAYGEIDLLVRKGGVLVVVEVKRRKSLESALDAVTPRQRERLRRAAQAVAARGGSPASISVRLDLMALAPGRLPRHIPDAWREN
ncbi:MAG TPA: YraN family protein [Caulobacteraceae bacterium]